ncbi:hypothetical protein DBR11_20860 [Pedobacter sp. HMWF019]|uniref:FecR family protein n=1 Tax=Pedobacter sp. HMWF019 TaxID=2056856 RepID=UPI000D3A7D7E|nr:FecR domain-containing protein [Pedobacter sp. HMWF019]PTS95632.1 hypothetical protein DBR11_20860 [Pedobacter sp. HMWF019]
MNENQIEFEQLLEKYTSGTASPEEVTLLNSLYNQLAEQLPSAASSQNLDQVENRVWKALHVQQPTVHYLPVLRYAAAILLIIGLGFMIRFALIHDKDIHTKTVFNDVAPGGNKAILTLGNGQKIVLNAHSNGAVATITGGGSITNNSAAGVVSYYQQSSSKAEGKLHEESKSMNTISTPAGGQYRLVLADGTRIFLNATSSISFPDRFTGSSRNVTLVGEGYFEVAKNPKQPFHVQVKDQQITVTGTHFNVSAYPADTVKTTLAEGSVTLLQPSTGKRQPLLPNQQAALLSSGFTIRHVKIKQEIAWIDGLFVFRHTPLKQAMQQIERWYNIEVDYSNLPDVPLDAELTRSLTLNRIIEILDTNADLKFKLIKNGRRLVYIGK